MQLVPSIIVLVLGLIVLISGFIAPGLAPLRFTGVIGMVLGLAGIGLSFIKKPEPDITPVEPMSFPARLAGMLFEPSKVFQNLRAHPRWLAMIVVSGLIYGAYQFAFVQKMTPETIAGAMTEKSIETAEGFTQQPLPPEQKAKIREQQLQGFKPPAARVAQFINAVGISAFFALFFGALYYILALIFGGKLTFWQSVAVTAHAGFPVVLISKILDFIVLLVKSPDDISPIGGLNSLATTDLGKVLFIPAQNPVLYTLAGLIGVFTIYGLWLTATGLKNGATKMSGGAAWGVVLTVFAITSVLKLGAAFLFPGFVG